MNLENARCVCWVLRNTTDHEAIDFALRLVGTIRWLGGGVDIDLLFDVIIPVFEPKASPMRSSVLVGTGHPPD